MHTFGTVLYVVGAMLGLLGGAVAMPLATLLRALATVTIFVCLNAHVLDYIARAEFGRSTTI